MNQLTETQAAYIAGFIDGEGCISYEKYKQGGRFYHRPVVIVSNTNLEVLEWICLATGIGRPKKIRQKPKHKEQYLIRWCYGAAIDILFQTLPFLKIKHSRAELILSITKRERESPVHSRELPMDVVAAREKVYLEMKELNRRGVN